MELGAQEWQFKGFLQAGLSADSTYADPYILARRSPVFGEDGSGQPSSDTSCIPRFLFDDGSGVESCRDLRFDTPVYSGSLSGSSFSLNRHWDESKLLLEAGFYSFANPYSPEISRLWFTKNIYSLGYGWSSFMGSEQELMPSTVDYGGPVGYAHIRQFGVRLQLNPILSFALEEPQSEVYLGLRDYSDNRNSASILKPRLLLKEDGNYEVDRRLRKRAVVPDAIFSYYDKGSFGYYSASLLLQYVRLDNNAPLFLEQDAGLLQLIEDANSNDEDAVRLLDRTLQLNDALSGGLDTTNLGVRLGMEVPWRAARWIKLSYIYNGGHYLRDNPNPSHIVVVNIPECYTISEADCEYTLVNIVSHSYTIDFDFANHWNGLLSGTFTEDEYAAALGGAGTSSLHSVHINRRQALTAGISAAYELAYLYHETFNGRNNADYPRLRFQYALYYSF